MLIIHATCLVRPTQRLYKNRETKFFFHASASRKGADVKRFKTNKKIAKNIASVNKHLFQPKIVQKFSQCCPRINGAHEFSGKIRSRSFDGLDPDQII